MINNKAYSIKLHQKKICYIGNNVRDIDQEVLASLIE